MHGAGDYVDQKHYADRLKRYPQNINERPDHVALHSASGDMRWRAPKVCAGSQEHRSSFSGSGRQQDQKI
jgi:hypothetical protein